MRQRSFVAFTRARQLVVAPSVERKYLVGSASSNGHSIKHHSSGRGVER